MTHFYKTLFCAFLTLTPNSFAAISDGLVAHWAFDEPSGTVATDTIGTSDGNIIDATIDQPGIVGLQKAFSFSGAGQAGGSDRVVMDEGFFIDGFTSLAIGAWIHPETIGSSVGHGGAGGSDANTIIEGTRLPGCHGFPDR